MPEKLIAYNQLCKAGYNRPINRTHVNNIKRNFCPDMVQPAIVSFRDGKYWIVDHQHQTQAIYERNGSDPNTRIRCDVRKGLTYEQEAELYYRLNTGSKPLGFNDKLAGLIESKDPKALEFRFTVESCGYVIGGNTGDSLNAIHTAWKIFNKPDGADTLTKVLTITKASWPSNNKGVHTHIIDGLVMFLERHGDEYKQDRMIKALEKEDPRTLVSKASTYYKQMDSKSFTKPYCMYSMMVNLYNKGLRNKINPVAPGM